MIPRWLAPLWFVAWIACGPRCLGAVPASSAMPVLSPALRELFDQLNADDFKTREAATQSLSNYGELIRPALLHAAHHGEFPELQSRAARLLTALPWSLPTDPPEVQQALAAYRSTEVEARIAAVRTLGGLGIPAFDALRRLLSEEPCDDVRWVIVEQLHHFTGDAQRERLRRLEVQAEDAPVLAAAGWGWLPSDAGKGLLLLGRSADLASPLGLEDPTELLLVLKTLYLRSLNVGNYAGAIDRLRQMILHDERPLSEVMLEVLALHAEYGPQRGFARDVELAEAGFYSPEMLYVFGRLYARQDQPLLADAMYRAAGLASMASQETHRRVAEFLIGQRWHDLAKIECEWMLATPGPQKQLVDAQAHVYLAHCQTTLGDDAAAAASIDAALQLIGRALGRASQFERQLRIEMDWYTLRVAEAKRDEAKMTECVDRLISLKPAESEPPMNSELQIDLINSLKTLHRDEPAKAMFDQLYDEYHHQLETDPNDPEVLNNLAWLCARCNEKVDDAIIWSTRAIRLAPANAAYLDTAAEAAAQGGQRERAVKLERAALKLQPGDRFMISQWVRFEKASREKN